MRMPTLPAACARAGVIEHMARADWATVADLHERHLQDVFRYVLRRIPIPHRQEAEDITAQVFTAAYDALPRFRGDCPLYPWLLGIARRQIALTLRRRSARKETLASELEDATVAADPAWEALASVEGPESTVMRAEARRVVRELLAQLNPDQRETILLPYVERLTVGEIAVVMGRSPAAVTGLLQRARANLYRLGAEYFGTSEEGTKR